MKLLKVLLRKTLKKELKEVSVVDLPNMRLLAITHNMNLDTTTSEIHITS